MYKIFPIFTTAAIIFSACSSTQETQVKKEETENVYVFDEIPPEDTFRLESPARETVDVYVVQIGAFINLENAKKFSEQSRVILNKEIKVEFNEMKNLYVVWINPPFKDRAGAENFRNQLWNYEEFKDAWIVTIESKK